jgi:predicted nucleotide-binding protein (sugar kinase/HSP70/actin superfamily)
LKIGIPRALLYYWYGSLWADYLTQCGIEVVISAPTKRETISAGAEVGVDELCLPMKIFLGHLRQLAGTVDRILIPHLIKVEKDAYICPKFMGLPDIAAHALPELRSQLLVLRVGPDELDMVQCLRSTMAKLGVKGPRHFCGTEITPAQQLIEGLRHFPDDDSAGITFGLLGHPYCLYDSCFNLNLLEKLVLERVRFLTPDQTPAGYHGVGSGKLAKDLFWTIGRSQFDALEWMLNSSQPRVDGFIQVVPFACGPEAIVGDMLERRIKEARKPMLKLYFEEHSGEAGMTTRLEAFLDLIRYRSRAC